MMSCAIEEAEFANAIALMSRQRPLRSRSQKAFTGQQLKMVRKKMTSVFTMISPRTRYPITRTRRVGKMSR